MTSTKTNPKPKMEMVAVDDLHLDPANARSHDARNLATIKASLARFGQQKPIVVNGDGVVIAGNGTLQAARDLGWEKISVVRSSLDGVDATAYAIADNRTSELATWDGGVLASTLAALQNDDSIDELVTGFDGSSIALLVENQTGADIIPPELSSDLDENGKSCPHCGGPL